MKDPMSTGRAAVDPIYSVPVISAIVYGQVELDGGGFNGGSKDLTA